MIFGFLVYYCLYTKDHNPQKKFFGHVQKYQLESKPTLNDPNHLKFCIYVPWGTKNSMNQKVYGLIFLTSKSTNQSCDRPEIGGREVSVAEMTRWPMIFLIGGRDVSVADLRPKSVWLKIFFNRKMTWDTRLWTVHEVYGPSHWKCLKWDTLGTDHFLWTKWLESQDLGILGH
jgi:hypothetical protein